jgi:hypothetical protein
MPVAGLCNAGAAMYLLFVVSGEGASKSLHNELPVLTEEREFIVSTNSATWKHLKRPSP